MTNGCQITLPAISHSWVKGGYSTDGRTDKCCNT